MILKFHIKGENQWIVVNFPKTVVINEAEFKFQGGFCSSQIEMQIMKPCTKKFEKLADFYPQDINSTQVFIKQRI